MRKLIFYVPGLPKPAGSKTAFCLKKGGVFTGRAVVTDACKKSKGWKRTVSHEAAIAMNEGAIGPDPELFSGPLRGRFVFHLPRIKAHYGTGKNVRTVKANAPHWPIVKPDVLKLTRAAEDALTGIVYRDDAQIVDEHITKVYALTPGCHIEIEELPT